MTKNGTEHRGYYVRQPRDKSFKAWFVSYFGFWMVFMYALASGASLLDGIVTTQDFLALPIVALSAYLALYFGNACPNVIIKEDGLLVSVFFTRFVKVPWANIVAIEEYDFWWKVKVSRLTLFHRLLGQGKEPHFLIYRGWPETPALIEYISRRCGVCVTGVAAGEGGG